MVNIKGIFGYIKWLFTSDITHVPESKEEKQKDPDDYGSYSKAVHLSECGYYKGME